MDITFRQLTIFRAVVVAGSITKASHRIGLSQPSISQQLARLEETLNAQLILRNRTGLVSMTPAGEYWYRASGEILERMETFLAEHDQNFGASNVVLRLGITPVLRGRFTTAAARIAQAESSFVKFEMVYELTSSLLVEQLRMHKVNFAIVSEASLAGEASGFAIARLYNDQMAWVVPANVPDEAIRLALTGNADPSRWHPALRHYVEIDPAVVTRAVSDDWYREHLPAAKPSFQAPTFLSATEFVADGLATTHIATSLLPNLSEQTLSNMKVFAVDVMSGWAVLAMRRHLLTHAAYARIFHRITDFCRNEFTSEMEKLRLRPLTDLTQPSRLPRAV